MTATVKLQYPDLETGERVEEITLRADGESAPAPLADRA